MHLGTVGKLLAWTSHRLFQQFLRFGVFLLMKVMNRLLVQFKLLFELRIHHLPHRFGMRRNCTNTLIFQRLMLMGSAARFSLACAFCRLPGASHCRESSRACLRRQRNSGTPANLGLRGTESG